MLRQLANAVLFQLGWFACALGGNSYWLWMTVGILLGLIWAVVFPALHWQASY